MESRLSSSSLASPPSPIPTGKGSRSAADSIFSEYVDKSIPVPKLNLPEYVHRFDPVIIDYPAFLSKDSDSINQLLRSAREFGVFLFTGHELSTEELQSTVEEAEWVFGLSLNCCFRDDREEFVWCHSNKAMVERAGLEIMGAEKYRSFSQKMKNLARKLESVAEELTQVITENISKQCCGEIQSSESKLSLYRYIHATNMDLNSHLSNEDSCEYALSLHLPVEQGEFYVQSYRGPMSFNTSLNTIIITIGKQVEEWSRGEFRSTYGRLKFKPNLHGSGTSFSFEFKFSPSNLNHILDNNNKTISIANQILIVFIIVLFYKIIAFIFS